MNKQTPENLAHLERLGLLSHHENIVRYARELSAEIVTLGEDGGQTEEGPQNLREWLDLQLSKEIWTKADGTAWKAEILLTYGGPTVQIELDSRWDSVDLFHSWGWANGAEEKRWPLSRKASAFLHGLIGEGE